MYGATTSVAPADHTSLIADLPEPGGELTIFTSVPGTVPLDQLEVYVGTLDVAEDLAAITATTEQPRTGGLSPPLPAHIRVGTPIRSSTDRRLVARQLLADDVAQLDTCDDQQPATDISW